MKEFFHDENDENDAANKVENPEEFIEVFDEVNKIFSRQTDSRLGVSAISAQPLVSQSLTIKGSLLLVLPLYLISTHLVPYFM